MTAAKRNTPLPNWPLYLSRDEAARYVGVSPNTFDREVELGMWPEPVTRGAKDGRLTWYRPAIEQAAQRRELEGETYGGDFNSWRAGFTARGEERPKTSRGRH